MRIGLIAVPEPSEPTAVTGLVTAIRAAADRGFATAWVPQPPPMVGVPGWDALTALTVAGREVPDIGLATSVVAAHAQHPLTLARQALSISDAVGGRLTLGIGISHRLYVTEMLGYPYTAPAAYFREYLEVLGPALAGEPVEHHGRQLTAVGQVIAPGAAAPKLIAAALGPKMLDIAGELADGVVTTWCALRALEGFVIPRLSAAAAAAGRAAPTVVAGLPVAVTDDPDSARAEITAIYGFYEHLPAYAAIMAREGGGVADISLIGDEAHVRSQLQRFADLGVDEFAASPSGDALTQARTIELLADFGH